ncbi:NAD(P)-dependent oxidoreductase [Halovenus salina]|uniref:NAD(P)-dependent oxidoreductase n=1 Tax=Halovenus salina TaxID=1510225 RepID=UPI002260B5AB|nr:NAD(P)-dependent oxidoreductase [Halovenus salina]
MTKILNLEPEGYSPKARSVLESFATVDEQRLSRRAMLNAVGDYDALIVRLDYTIDREVFEHANNLGAVATATTGLNHVDTEAADKHGAEIICLRGEREFLDSIYATAEHTWALLLACIRSLPDATTHVERGGWDRDQFKGHELHGATLGVLGYGRLGSKIARYGTAFGMDVLSHDPNVSEGEYATFVDFEELLRESDYLSIHVPYNDSTEELIGPSEFELMKPGSYLVNTSRGEIIEEDALLESLEEGQLAGAALDVLRGEYTDERDWTESDPLVEYAATNPNLIITPHVAGATHESMEKTEIFIAEKLAAYFDA